MEILFLESNNINQTKNAKHTNHDAVSQRVQGGIGVACSSDGKIKGQLATPRARMSTVRRGRQRLFQRLEDAAMFETWLGQRIW